MLRVRKEFCAGCGICARVCPTGAITLDAGTAEIDQVKCIDCYRCLQACPRGAIVAVGIDLESAVPSVQELRRELTRLQAEMERAARRLESLGQRRKMRLS